MSPLDGPTPQVSQRQLGRRQEQLRTPRSSCSDHTPPIRVKAAPGNPRQALPARSPSVKSPPRFDSGGVASQQIATQEWIPGRAHVKHKPAQRSRTPAAMAYHPRLPPNPTAALAAPNQLYRPRYEQCWATSSRYQPTDDLQRLQTRISSIIHDVDALGRSCSGEASMDSQPADDNFNPHKSLASFPAFYRLPQQFDQQPSSNNKCPA